MPVAVPQGASPLLLPDLATPRLDHLANGAAVVSLSLPDAPLTCLDFWCRAGSAWEAPQESGLAHFLEHMVFKGSAQLEAGEFDRRIEALGGSSNAATGFDDVHYHVLIPPEAADQALDLLLDLVLRPRLEEEAFAMERQVVLEELAQSEDQPEEIAMAITRCSRASVSLRKTTTMRADSGEPFESERASARSKIMTASSSGMPKARTPTVR